MTYIIIETCIDVKDAGCVDVCPVDCIYEGETMYYINPDECIDCAACEPVCPSGVEYGTLLELARDTAARHRPPGRLTRLLLAVISSRRRRAAFFLPGRLLRGLRLAALGARVLPPVGPLRSVRLALAMLAASLAAAFVLFYFASRLPHPVDAMKAPKPT